MTPASGSAQGVREIIAKHMYVSAYSDTPNYVWSCVQETVKQSLYIDADACVKALATAGFAVVPRALLEDEYTRGFNIGVAHAAVIAESYEPHCESCPRGVANAIMHITRDREAMRLGGMK